jgi:hypothetical protein
MITKNYEIITLLLVIFLLPFCSSDANRQKKAAKHSQQPDSQQGIKVLSHRKSKLGELFDNSQSFEIISFENGTTSAFTFTDTIECKGWTISKNQLYKIIQNSTPISGTTWDLAFGFHSCIITGELLQAQEKFEFELNGGSWMYIKCRDTTLLLGDYNKADREYFLSSPEFH